MRRSKWLLVAFATLVGAVLSTTASAAPGITGKTTANANANANGPVAVLHQAHKLLETAIHDYDGHRAKAAHLIKEAIRELGGNHQGKNKAAGGIGNKAGGAGNKIAPAAQGNANQETQAQSDAQLAQAIKLLQGLNLTNNAKAAEHVQEAITELNTALKIK